MKYQWLLFDADGTLFDYERAEQKALQQTIEDFGLTFSPQILQAYQRINRQIWIDFENGRISAEELRTRRFELLFEEMDLEASAVEFSPRYLGNLAGASDLVDGAEEVVRSLSEQFHLAIITNGLLDVQMPRLEKSGIGKFFTVVFVSEEIGATKPDSRFFETVFSRLGQPPREAVLVIGDSLTSDIQGGLGFGLDTCWYNPAHRPPDPRFPATYEIQSLQQLERLLVSSI